MFMLPLFVGGRPVRLAIIIRTAVNYLVSQKVSMDRNSKSQLWKQLAGQ